MSKFAFSLISVAKMTSSNQRFTFPPSLASFEEAPYNFSPYPEEFDEDAEGGERDGEFKRLLEDCGRVIDSDEGLSTSSTQDEPCTYAQTQTCPHRLLHQNLYTLIRKFTSLSPPLQNELLTMLRSTLASSLKTLSATDDFITNSAYSKIGLLMYWLSSIMSSTENAYKLSKSSTKSATTSDNFSTMLLLSHAFNEYSNRMWTRGVRDESYVMCPARLAFQSIENKHQKNSTTKKISTKIISNTVKGGSCESTVVAGLVDLMCSCDSAAGEVAMVCKLTGSESFGQEILRDVITSCRNGSGKGEISACNFLPMLAVHQGNLIVKNWSLIMPLLGRDVYQFRSAVCECVGVVCGGKVEVVEEEVEEQEEEDEVKQEDKPNREKTVNQLLDVLTQRGHDQSSFTRTSVLKSFRTLLPTLPVDRFQPVTELAIDRLKDKTVIVRRNAMILLKGCLEENPFSGSLDPTPYEKKLTELKKWFEENELDSAIAAKKVATLQKEEEEREGMAISEEAAEQNRQEIEHAIKTLEGYVEEEQSDSEENLAKQSERAAKIKALQFTTSALLFISSLESVNESLSLMLLSKSMSDVTEALKFFVRAKEFSLPCAVSGMRKALSLVFSNEKTIQEQVLTAFTEVFLSVPGSAGKQLLEPKQIAHNLIVLCGESTMSERTSIEEALRQIVSKETIPNEVFLILWSVASKATGPARSAAMLVLSMASSADASIVDSSSRLRHLCESGFGSYVETRKDYSVARSAARALMKVGRIERGTGNEAKMLIGEDIIEGLCTVIRGDWINDAVDGDEVTRKWFGAAEDSINALFSFASEPDFHASEMIKSMSTLTFSEDEASPLQLARFLFVVGHIAIKLLLYTESLTKELKKANSTKTVVKQEAADKKKRENKKKKDGEESDDDAIEAELGVAQEQEAVTEQMMADIAEKEIVGRGLLGVFGPIILRVVADESGEFNDNLLKQCAMLALCKFSCISNAFCTKNLPLILTSLSKNADEDTTLRANTVIALGDIAFRFPNTFEPYTPYLYKNLRDGSDRVKRHAMMVLTHLILNDMIKVKGQVCEVAMLIVSDDVSLNDMSRLLFNELSKRSNNPVYNLIPDVVGQMSVNDAVRKADFKTIMTFLLGFITKDRQSDGLVDKLVKRFETAASIKVKRDLTFCIATLKVTEKAVKILNDAFKLYKDSLYDEEIFGYFMNILKKGKSFANANMKQVVEELENKIQEENTAGSENHDAANKAERAKQKAAKRQANKIERKKALAKKKQELDDIEEEDDFIEYNPNDKKKGETWPLGLLKFIAPPLRPRHYLSYSSCCCSGCCCSSSTSCSSSPYS
ncbi:hypothetical protein TL16_g11810 [Triparma laevis f. inornata]|uniref:Condensin complex subunit 1 C-terminal domain-containing protein n=1 Tax=Triparma laevis f. inornata TaxID=1714386 RepID=A0A9W7BGB0_9STRA|nr:hypothetical protein TL16_g11810 [Triparma laevis f. inornata]